MAELQIVHADAVETSGQDLRTGYEGLQEGVVGAGDLKCVPGAGLSIDAPAGVAYVQGDSIPDQQLYRCRNDATKNTAAFELGGVPAAHATLPRLDQIIARAYDHAADASGLRKWRLEVLAGTATAGATLDNRNGAAALPASACRLLDFLTPATFAGPYVAATHFRDRRPWARGAHQYSARTAGDLTVTSASFVLLSAEFEKRIECSGAPLVVAFQPGYTSTASGTVLGIAAFVDGAAFATSARVVIDALASGNPAGMVWELNGLTPGSHLISIFAARVSGAGTATVAANATVPARFRIREELTQSADNG